MLRTTHLRQLLAKQELILAPGVYDGISARLAEQAGSVAIYMTGAGVSASLGYPDLGLVTMTEMVERARAITRGARIPVISDADTGYGNELNVTRTVQEFEGSGVAAIHIEDQVSPKRCGHMDGKDVISKAEFTSKIRAAANARRDPDFVIVARTDARAVHGFDDAIDRANSALDVGADVAFVEAAVSLEEVEAIPQRVHGPCLINVVQGGRTPIFDLQQLQEMGFRIAIVPVALLFPAVLAIDAALTNLLTTRVAENDPNGMKVQQLFERMGSADWLAIQKQGVEK